MSSARQRESSPQQPLCAEIDGFGLHAGKRSNCTRPHVRFAAVNPSSQMTGVGRQRPFAASRSSR
jgi:hypothetical protein